MLLHYRALAPDGRLQQGLLEAAHPADLEQRLARMGLFLLRCHPAQRWALGRLRLSRRERISFCFHMEQLTGAGVTVPEALRDLRDSLPDGRFQSLVAHLLAEIEGGQRFSQALASQPGAFDPLFIQLIAAGEASGELPAVLHQLTDTLKWHDELAAQSRKLLIYPAFVATLLGAVLVFLLLYLVPRLVEFLHSMGQSLPWPTRALLGSARWLHEYGALLLTFLALLGLGLRLSWQYSPAFRLRSDALLLRLPRLGPILQTLILARLARFLAMLHAAGLPLLDSLALLEGIAGNAALARALHDVQEYIRQGQGISASFARSHYFPPLFLRLLRVGEATGRLDKALQHLAYFYQRDGRDAIARLQIWIEPCLTVLLGLLLAWMMSAVLGPIFDALGRLQ